MNNDNDTIDRLNEAFSNAAYHRDVNEFVQAAHRTKRRRRTTRLIVAATATAALATGGVVAARQGLPDPTRYAQDARSTEQVAAVSDEVVTFDEYQAGFRRFAACMEANGRPISNVEFDQATQLYRWEYDGVDDCYERELYALDVTWQLDPNRPGHVEQRPARELLDEACLAGGPVPGFPIEGEQLAELCDLRDGTQPDGG